MQYKYQEVFCNFLPTLSTDCLCGTVKPTAFGPLRHCKNYTFIVMLRDATLLSCFFPNKFFPTWPALWAAELQAGCKEKPVRLPSLFCSCLFGGVITTASLEVTMWTSVQRAQTGKTLAWSPNYPNENLLTWIILLCDTVTHGPSIKWKTSCMATDITTQTMFTIIAW